MKLLTREDAVGLFNHAAGNKTKEEGGSLLPQVNCFTEEVSELMDAIVLFTSFPNEKTRENLVKEWADVQVTLSNLAWFFDINGQVAFNRVHASNMSKIVDGEIKRREDGKILKPDTYVAPSMKGL